MRLYLLRHGKAVKDHEDRTRPLAPRGERQARWLGDALADRELGIERVLHSPKLRARRTAELFCERALPDVPRELFDHVLPDDDLDLFLDRLNREERTLLLVGHNPFLEELTERLTGGFHRFKTSTFACLERDGEGRWSVAWSETPPRYTKVG